MKVIDLAS
jgi:ABC-type bacteriocin/lantibiotic exporter with double-glycine peptidase domain